jgi:bacterioferritin-associated ferredoxin
VTLREIRAAVAAGAVDVGAVKMRTRLGMGACQGRFCAAAAAALVSRVRGAPPEALGRIHARPPVRPVTLGALARMETTR